jgi:hypothetical protein
VEIPNRKSQIPNHQLLTIALTVASLVALPVQCPKSAIAGTCVAGSSCSAPPIQFVPGQPISIEVANLTAIPVSIQYIGTMNPLVIAPRQTVSVLRGTTVSPNFSLIFWTSYGGQLIANVSQPTEQVLRIEIRSGGRIAGNNAVYLKDDGRVEVF